MRTTLAIFFLGAALSASAAAPKQPPPKDFSITGDAARGKRVYLVNCASCHGKSGHGDGMAGRMLKPPPASFSDMQRFAAVSDWELYVAVKEGGPAVRLSSTMPGWNGTLKEQEIHDVVAYVKAAFIDPARKAQRKNNGSTQ